LAGLLLIVAISQLGVLVGVIVWIGAVVAFGLLFSVIRAFRAWPDSAPPGHPLGLVDAAAKRRDVAYLINALAEPTMRGSAALRLGDLREPSAVPALIRNLRVRRDIDRNPAVIALRKIGDPAAIPALLEVARTDDSWAVRNSAIHALASLGDPEGARLLARLAINPNTVLQGTLRAFNEGPSFFSKKRTPLRWERRWAMKMLRELNPSEAIPILDSAKSRKPTLQNLRLAWTIHSIRKHRGGG